MKKSQYLLLFAFLLVFSPVSYSVVVTSGTAPAPETTQVTVQTPGGGAPALPGAPAPGASQGASFTFSGSTPGPQQQGVQAAQVGGPPRAAEAGAGGGGAPAGAGGPGGAISGTAKAVKQIINPPKPGGPEVLALPPPPEPETTEIVREMVIDNSINAYAFPCACPYSRNADGFECGVESAYYKPGGFRILCYKEDVRDQLLIFYRKTH